MAEVKRGEEKLSGYSRSPRAIEKVKPILDQLVESKTSLEWTYREPRKVAYYIWQAITYSIKSGKKEYRKYASLSARFKIKVVQPDSLVAELRYYNNQLTPDGIVIRNVWNAVTVIGMVILYDNYNKLTFPEFVKTQEEFELLEEYCKNKKLSITIDDYNRLTVERILD